MGSATRLGLTAVLTAMCCLVLPWVIALASPSVRRAVIEGGNHIVPLVVLCSGILLYGVLLGFQGRLLDRWGRPGPAATAILVVAAWSIYFGWSGPGPFAVAGPQVLVGTLAYLGFSAVMLCGSRRRAETGLHTARSPLH